MTSIKELDLSTRVFNAIGGYRYDIIDEDPEYGIEAPYDKLEKVTTIERLIELGLQEVSRRPNMGKAAMNELIYKVKKWVSSRGEEFDEKKFCHFDVKEPQQKVPKIAFNFGPRKEGYIYAIEAEGQFTKIGRSKYFPEKRIRALNTGCPLHLKLMGYIQTEDMLDLESSIHYKLTKYHKKGEWFSVEYSKIKQITDFSWCDYTKAGSTIQE